MDLSIVIVNYNGGRLILECLDSLSSAALESTYEVIVVDNQSTDGSSEQIRQEFPEIKIVVAPRNGGFGYGNNLGIRAALGEFLFLLNSDTILLGDAVDRMIGYMRSNPRVGALGCRCVNPDGLEIPAGHSYTSLRSKALQAFVKPVLERAGIQRKLVSLRLGRLGARSPRSVDWLAGSGILIRRQAYLELGGFDEGFFMYLEDEDLCRRVHARGLDVLVWPEIGYVHVGGGSSTAGPFLLSEYYRSSLLYMNRYAPAGSRAFRALTRREVARRARAFDASDLGELAERLRCVDTEVETSRRRL